MRILLIKDLSRTEVLDAKAMAAVQGGMKKGMPSYWLSVYDGSKHDDSLTASQSIGQSQEVFNANGNNVAFAGDIHSTVKPTQTASNNIFRS
ncbi:MAG TPA: hypothetical protein VJ576_10060 [Rhodocyclaceae bacterium]|nr:hypothetical protein [Rhodocyclaceae bacterium]